VPTRHARKGLVRAPRTFGLLLALLGCAAAASGQHIGYLYPAGAKQGSAIQVTVGGQYLGQTHDIYITGSGVEASVVEHIRPLSQNELGYTGAFLRNLVKRRWGPQAVGTAARQPYEGMRLADHPWLRGLDHRSPAELDRLRAALFDPRRQPNAQIAEQVVIEVRVAPDAAPGDRELRVATPGGLSNPMAFQIGTLPEVSELQPVVPELPVVLNGQIMPGEVDRFSLTAHKGQRLVFRTQARRLVPYLADAVPGWFQATLALYDSRGSEVAYADDYLFDPDPVLLYEVPKDGEYVLEVRDSIYRGREDFVYRITVGELPFVTSMFPLGGRAGEPTVASVRGWNLPADTVEFDTRPEGNCVRSATIGTGLSNELRYAVDTLPECTETEPNDNQQAGQQVTMPVIVNGRVDRVGDRDVFAFDGKADEELVVEVSARRLGSPLDSAVRLLDAAGAVLASNDDHEDRASGLVTHHADSYLRAQLPTTGTYFIQLLEAQRQGGEAYAYRLCIRPLQPDFALRVTPSSLGMPGHRPAQLTVHALRKDGFAGAIDLALRDTPPGFSLSSTRIPAAQDKIELTLRAPQDAPCGIYPVRIEGQAQIGDTVVTRPVVPAEDMMQAFAYWHLVPQQELVVCIPPPRPFPVVWRPLVQGIELADEGALRIPLGGTARLRLKAPPVEGRPALGKVRFALSARPRGVTLETASVQADGAEVTLQADSCLAEVGDTGNVIIEAFVETQTAGPRGEPTQRKTWASLGVLPAVPVEVVAGEL